MIRDKPLHNFLFELDEDSFYSGLETFCTPWIDTCVILTLIRNRKPKTFLEVGTHKGYTVRNIKRKFPDLVVTTVDPGDKIPADERPPGQRGEYLPQDEVGCLLGKYSDVEILKQRFEDIVFGDRKFDFIFVNGDHRYNEVIRDTALALKLVNRPGVIIWHDFNNVKAVNDAIATFTDLEVITLHNTWIGYCEID